MIDGVVIWWISKLMYVCVSFHVLTQLGGCMNFSKNERTDQGGSKEASIRFTRLGGLKRVRLQIAYRWQIGAKYGGC